MTFLGFIKAFRRLRDDIRLTREDLGSLKHEVLCTLRHERENLMTKAEADAKFAALTAAIDDGFAAVTTETAEVVELATSYAAKVDENTALQANVATLNTEIETLKAQLAEGGLTPAEEADFSTQLDAATARVAELKAQIAVIKA